MNHLNHRFSALDNKTSSLAILLAALLSVLASPPSANATMIYESGMLGPTGVSWEEVYDQIIRGANIGSSVFQGVRFELRQPVIVNQIGGHFVAPISSSFFGAVIELDDENDFPDSGDLSTSDVLGEAILKFPVASTEVCVLVLVVLVFWHRNTLCTPLRTASNRRHPHPIYVIIIRTQNFLMI